MFLELPHDRHPERSASRIYRLTEGLQRVVEEPVLSVAEGTPRMLVGRCSSQLSGHQNNRRNQKSQPPSVPGFPTSPPSLNVGKLAISPKSSPQRAHQTRATLAGTPVQKKIVSHL